MGETLTGNLFLYYHIPTQHSLTSCTSLIDGFQPPEFFTLSFPQSLTLFPVCLLTKTIIQKPYCSNQWFSTHSNSASGGTFGIIWRHFWCHDNERREALASSGERPVTMVAFLRFSLLLSNTHTTCIVFCIVFSPNGTHLKKLSIFILSWNVVLLS